MSLDIPMYERMGGPVDKFMYENFAEPFIKEVLKTMSAAKVKKYRTKPCEIEAIQFTRCNMVEVKEFTEGKAYNFTTEKRPDGKCYCFIDTLEGTMRANEMDYIIKGLRGEFYPCKADVFAKKYEEVEEQ